MKSLLIVPAPQGQLANRLINLAHIRAFAIEKKLPMIHCAFYPYTELFEGPKNSLFCLYDDDGDFLKSPNAQKLAQLYSHYRKTIGHPDDSNEIDLATLERDVTPQMREEFFAFGFVLRAWVKERVFSSLSASYFELGNDAEQIDQYPPVQEALANSDMILLDGWGWRYEYGVHKHRAEILNYLNLSKEDHTKVNTLVAFARAKGELLIGVHVRRGDYQQWLDGKYFFELEVFRNVMQSALRRYSDKKISFLVCGTEKMSESDFAGLPVTVSTEEPHIDLYSLAQCDITVGPPSTFTAWACFVNPHPHLSLSSPEVIF